MKTILVTGCAGFIGSHLCGYLLAKGHKVVGVDDLSMGSMENMSGFIKNPDFTFYPEDITTYAFDMIFTKHKIDTVFHLAANSDISIGKPEVELKNTFVTTYEVLKKCKLFDIKELIFASSGSIYGKAKELVGEDYGPLLPISHYAAAKLSSEAWISSCSSMYGIKAWICRFPSVVGEHATHGVIPDFIKKLKINPDVLDVLGNGHQTKPYMYVRDVIDAMLFIWKNAGERINYYNIAGIGRTSVREIAEMVIEEMGLTAKIVYQDHEEGWPGDVTQYSCSTEKLQTLGFKMMTILTSNDAVRLSIKKILQES